jgi:hypothetical protein
MCSRCLSPRARRRRCRRRCRAPQAGQAESCALSIYTNRARHSPAPSRQSSGPAAPNRLQAPKPPTATFEQSCNARAPCEPARRTPPLDGCMRVCMSIHDGLPARIGAFPN